MTILFDEGVEKTGATMLTDDVAVGRRHCPSLGETWPYIDLMPVSW